MDLFNSSAFDIRVNDLLSQWPVPGLAFAVVQNGTIASKGFGLANLDDATPITADTLFDIASCSKSFTAASVALLIDNNDDYPQLQWNATMSSLLHDDFVMAGTGYTENVTVEDILSHRSGLAGHDFARLGIRADHPDTPWSVTRNLRNLDISAPIRTEFMYSNTMYIVATFLIKQITGLWFADFLQKYFFSPLCMNSTHLQPEAAIAAGLKDRIATPYSWREDSKTYHTVQLMQVPEAQGAGSIFTSVNDHIKWVKAVMNQESPVSPAIYRNLVKPRIIENPEDDSSEGGYLTSPTYYAAGWESIYYRGHEIIHHNGLTSGFSSFQFFLPEFKFGGVAFGNSGWAGSIGERLCLELIFELIKAPVTDFPDWDTVAKFIKELEEEESKELREELCPGIEEAQPQKWPLSTYTGRYWNAGYRGMNTEIKDSVLFVNATDRSDAFTLTFEHICKQTKYVARLHGYYEGDEEEIAAEFRVANGKITHMGLKLEEDIDGLIWFKKEAVGGWTDQTFALSDFYKRQVILVP